MVKQLKKTYENETFYKTYYNSPFGVLSLFSDGNSLIEIRFPSTRYHTINDESKIEICDTLTVFSITKTWLNKYFNSEKPDINDLPLKFIGSEFRKKVMSLLCEIPYGTVVTYGEIAHKINPKMSAQAVGNAVGHNPLCIVVPCHRVIGINQNLVGFGGGLDLKKLLLKHEGVDISKLKTPTKGNAL